MIIKLSPIGEPYGHPFEAPLSIKRTGQSLEINGKELDFSVIPNGATLEDASEATNCPYIVGNIDRDMSGVLHITLLFPHASNAPYEARFPEIINNPPNGNIKLPDSQWPPHHGELDD